MCLSIINSVCQTADFHSHSQSEQKSSVFRLWRQMEGLINGPHSAKHRCYWSQCGSIQQACRWLVLSTHPQWFQALLFMTAPYVQHLYPVGVLQVCPCANLTYAVGTHSSASQLTVWINGIHGTCCTLGTWSGQHTVERSQSFFLPLVTMA